MKLNEVFARKYYIVKNYGEEPRKVSKVNPMDDVEDLAEIIDTASGPKLTWLMRDGERVSHHDLIDYSALDKQI